MGLVKTQKEQITKLYIHKEFVNRIQSTTTEHGIVYCIRISCFSMTILLKFCV